VATIVGSSISVRGNRGAEFEVGPSCDEPDISFDEPYIGVGDFGHLTGVYRIGVRNIRSPNKS